MFDKIKYALLIYLCFINFIGVIINIIDKSRAKRSKWRIKEQTLWIVSILGGAFGSYVTMQIIRHKTKHKSFMIGLPAIITIQAIILIWLQNI